MKKGLLSLSREAVERSRQAAYPANAPQRRPAQPPKEAAPFKTVPETPPTPQQPKEPPPAPAPKKAGRTLASGFLKEAMASHAAMAARARSGKPPETQGERSILSPVRFAQKDAAPPPWESAVTPPEAPNEEAPTPPESAD